MGRLFVIELHGPVYKCKECHTDLALRNDIVSEEDLGVHGTLYEFRRLFNMFLAAGTLPSLHTILCVYCTASIGSYYMSEPQDDATTYGVSRRKLHGPEGSDDEV